MILNLSIRHGIPGQPETTLTVTGDVLTVDGIAFDLSPIPEGGQAEAGGEHPFIGPIRRESGVIRATVKVRLGGDAEPVQPADPAHWTVSASDGPVIIPAIRRPLEPHDEPEVQE